MQQMNRRWLHTRPTLRDRLRFFKEAISDAAVTETSARLRVGAAHDAAVIAGFIVAELDGHPIEARHPARALAYLLEDSSIRSGLSAHVSLLSRFDRDDYDRIWTSRDASRSLTSATRIRSALCWRMPWAARVLVA